MSTSATWARVSEDIAAIDREIEETMLAMIDHGRNENFGPLIDKLTDVLNHNSNADVAIALAGAIARLAIAIQNERDAPRPQIIVGSILRMALRGVQEPADTKERLQKALEPEEAPIRHGTWRVIDGDGDA